MSTTVTTATAASTHQIFTCSAAPLHWVVQDLKTGHRYLVPAIPQGWQNRKAYRGHAAALKPATGYNYISLGVPQVRDWKTVCHDSTGKN